MATQASRFHGGFRDTIGDATGDQLAILLRDDYKVLHVASAADAMTDWNVAAPTNPTLYIHSETTPATDYISLDHDATDGTINVASGNLKLAIAGTDVVTVSATGLTNLDDGILGIGTGDTARFSWDTTDANANALLLQLPAGGAVDVPVLAIGQSIESVDLGLYNGVVDPKIAMFGVGAVTTGPTIEFRKARGTVASPTVVTTGDDIGQILAYGAVAAGEYVQAASIEFDMAGTIATTRGPGTITFKTATDAAPSVLTTALTISAAQLVTAAAGLTVTTGTVTVSGTTETTGAGTGIVQIAGGLAADKKLATGKASGTTGAVLFSGTTSGVVTLSVGDAAGTWTMKLPGAVGGAGEQLTDAGGNGVTSWAAAASKREFKNVLGVVNDKAGDALDRMLKANIYHFKYKDGKGTQDTETLYEGIMADEYPQVMHYKGGILNPINAFGETVLAIKALTARLSALEAKVA